ncbi:SDR family NAD(P)-dependent oxidoreductase, partial [Chryseobacterium sp. CH1]|uniref:SDR family NAD(P)-dependent oxidoreductase n=1 Tax=Chryseobacterium sp. CH1 TaxID=713551 RepID=UPI00100B1DFA
ASTAGLKGGPNMSAYAASKAAVVSLSQSMMAEWRKQNIRVITLTPSTIASDMSIQGGLTDGNPASTAGLKGGPNMSAYAASKAAVVSLSQSMMAEW